MSGDRDPSSSPGGRRRRRRRRGGGSAGSSGGNAGGEQGGGSAGAAGSGVPGAGSKGSKGSGGGKNSKGSGGAKASKGSRGSKGSKASGGSKGKRGRPGGGDASNVRATRREVSAGGVVYRHGDEGLEILLAARRTRRGDLAWGLAKGGIEPEESIEDAAVREVREETGIVAEIEESLGETRYFYVWDDVRVRKVVHFFLMRALGGDTEDHDDEMEDVRWFPLARALKRAAYRGEREVLDRAAERLR